MPDTIDGTIQEMRDRDPQVEIFQDGEIFRSRENSEPTRESIFAWDPTPYDGPLYNSGEPLAPDEVPQYVGFAPDISGLEDGSQGVWRWVSKPAGFTDAELVYGISPFESPANNSTNFQRCIDEALLSHQWVDGSGNRLGGIYHILLPAGHIRLEEQTRFHTVGLTDNYGGRLVFKGHGSGTTLIYEGSQGAHAFLMGVPVDNYQGERTVELVLEDLVLEGTTNTDFAVFRMYHAWSTHVLRNVIVRQLGAGNGIDATNIWLGIFDHVIIDKPGSSGNTGTGKGLWMRTTLDGVQDDVFVSGEFTMNRVSAWRFETGILFGDPQLDPVDDVDNARLLLGISAQFLNAEACEEGIVFGAQARDIDVSVAWVEQNRRCGIRIYNGAADISLRRIYMVHQDDSLSDFEGEIVLGKDPTLAGPFEEAEAWNRYQGIDLDGVFQHQLIWPAVRLWSNPSDDSNTLPDEPEREVAGSPVSRVRDVSIRNVKAGDILKGATIQTDAIVKLEDESYDSLVIEFARPDIFGGLPSGVELVQNPHRVDQLRYSGPVRFYPFEKRRQRPAMDEVLHTPHQGLNPPWLISIEEDAPFYHRIDGPNAIVTLPVAHGRRSLEYHLMTIYASNATIQGEVLGGSRQKINDAQRVTLTEKFAFVQLRPNKLQDGSGVWRWEVVAQSPFGVTYVP